LGGPGKTTTGGKKEGEPNALESGGKGMSRSADADHLLKMAREGTLKNNKEAGHMELEPRGLLSGAAGRGSPVVDKAICRP